MIDFELKIKGSLHLSYGETKLIWIDTGETVVDSDEWDPDPEIIHDCRHVFVFDSEFMHISTYHKNSKELMSLLFPLNKQFISQLKSMISCIESNGYKDSNTGEWINS